MRSKLVLALGCVFACASLWAAPPACVTGTLASYIHLGAQGCTFAGATYANFAYSAGATGGAQTITAEEITVTPMAGIVGETRLSFSAPWEVAKDQTQDSIIAYTAVLPCGDATPALLDLTLGHSNIAGIIGAVAVDETTNVGKLAVYGKCADACQTKNDDSLQFNPVGVVLVTDHVKLTGGVDGASLDEFASGMNLCLVCA